MANDILIVDDEKDICQLIAGILDDEGFETRQALSSGQALEEVQKRMPSLVILDVWLQGSEMDGLSVLRYLKALDAALPVIVISGHGNFDTALSAIHRGAYDYLEKPFKAEQLLLVVNRAIELSKLKAENQKLKKQRIIHEDWIGESSAAQKTRSEVQRLAASNARVLIQGEKGVGKRLVAKLIHQNSERANGPFVVLGALGKQNQNLETDFFGAEANVHSPQKIGFFERAHKGTIVLDCLPDLPHSIQKRILKILTDGKFLRQQGKDPVQVDIRCITTTTTPLEPMVDEGKLLGDLYARIKVTNVHVPPLSKRRDDIPLLVEYFVDEVASKTGLNARKFSDEAVGLVQSMPWPGNIRQLRNFIERILILSSNDMGTKIGVDELSYDNVGEIGALSQSGKDYTDIIGLSLRDAREQFERNYLRMQITRFNGNVSRTAEFIGMERSALHRKMKSLGIN